MNTHVTTVCRIGQGHACCRYLGAGPSGLECFKLNGPLRDALDARVAVGTMVARGDNCEGRDGAALREPS